MQITALSEASRIVFTSRFITAYSVAPRPIGIFGNKRTLSMTLSARNRLEGKITELQLGGVMAHVTVKVGDNLIESVITRRSAEEMKLKVGDTVSAIIKSTEVMLEKP